MHDGIRLKHYAYSTEKAYVYWARCFVLYHGEPHPLEMGEREISESLTYLAVEEDLAADRAPEAGPGQPRRPVVAGLRGANAGGIYLVRRVRSGD